MSNEGKTRGGRLVIAGLVPAISIRRAQGADCRDGGDKPGHDQVGTARSVARVTSMTAAFCVTLCVNDISTLISGKKCAHSMALGDLAALTLRSAGGSHQFKWRRPTWISGPLVGNPADSVNKGVYRFRGKDEASIVLFSRLRCIRTAPISDDNF